MIASILFYTLFMQIPAVQFNQANALYRDGKYAEAIVLYEETAASAQHPDLFFNLGNAYFKQGNMGKTILNYRRAFFLAPRDQDIIHNLQFVRNYRVDKIRIQESPFSVLLRRTFQILSMFETQILATILFLLFMFLLSVFIIMRRSFFGYLSLIAFVLCLFTGLNWLAWSNTLHARNSIITVPEVSALSGPGIDYKEILRLHDGAEVRIREKRGDYVLIQLPGGLGGWVPVTSLEEIF